MIRVGIGGWIFEPWRGTFFPKGLPKTRELHHASRAVTTIEINSTYYSAQKPETFRKWAEQTPDDFVFAVKASRFATNRRVLAEAGQSVERFVTQGITELKKKLGPILWQFAPTKKFDAADFEAFLKLLPGKAEGHELRHAVEARHGSFRVPEVVDMARHYGVALVVAGDSEYPQIPDATAPFVYARIMGTKAKEPLGYSAAALDLWAERARSWAAGGVPEDLESVAPAKGKQAARDVYLYVISGHKVANPAAAQALIERVK